MTFYHETKFIESQTCFVLLYFRYEGVYKITGVLIFCGVFLSINPEKWKWKERLNLKKPFYKKWWFIAIVVVFVLAIIGNGMNGTEDESKANVKEVEKKDIIETPSKDEKPKDVKEEIKEITEGIISKDLNRAKINNLMVNNFQGEENKFIVLPHLKWEVKNGKGTTIEMLEMYSDNLAAKLYEREGIEEITVFWEVPHHLEGDNIAKFNYTRTDNGMAKMDKWLDPVLQ